MDLAELAPERLEALSDEEFRAKLAEVVTIAQKDRQENALRYYRPPSETAARVFESDARVFAIGGGNGSGKTEQVLALTVACATGVFPDCMRHLVPKRFRGPIRVRIVCESITTVLYPTMLPKLQWFCWTGVDAQGGERGHWGWIPPYCLVDRSWEKSWTEKLRMLRVLCRDPNNPDVVLGESVIQFMSYDQDSTDFASGDYHIVVHDEPPPLAIWRENEARTMRVAGRLLLSMTWPDDPAIPVDWIFDEVYEPGMAPERPGKPREVEWVNLYTTDNPNLDQSAVKRQSGTWSEEMRRVRIYGQPIRFSNRVHPLFTDQTQFWCHPCGKTVMPEEVEGAEHEWDRWRCPDCQAQRVCSFNHVREFEVTDRWPTVWALDPHPRKPHMALWTMVDPSDDLWVVDELAVDGDPVDVRREVDRIEGLRGISTAVRLIDPNMGRSPSSSRRNIVWQDDFDAAGLVTELADDAEVGRKHLNTFLKPDDRRQQPRIHVHPRCQQTIAQIKRYSWDEYKRASEKEQKQTPKPKYDDYPTLLKYVMNYAPTFAGLRGSGAIFQRAGTRRGAY